MLIICLLSRDKIKQQLPIKALNLIIKKNIIVAICVPIFMITLINHLSALLFIEVANGSQNGDMEQREVKLKYPRAIPFIISNELCERFNYYGMRSELND